MLDNDKDRLDATLQRLPENYRKLARVGAYGAFFPYYICGIAVPRQRSAGPHRAVSRGSDKKTGRCAEH